MENYTILEFDVSDFGFDWEEIARNPHAPIKPRKSVSAFKTYYNRIISSAKDSGVVPVLVSLPPVDADNYYDFITRSRNSEEKDNILQWLGGSPEFLAEWQDLYNEAIFDLGAENGVPVVDVTAKFRQDHELMGPDGMHPNENGLKLIADTINAALGSLKPTAPLVLASA